MTDNACPYCGGKVVAGFTEFRGVQGYQARCFGCGAAGPVIIVASEVWHIEIVDAFCHPAHLMKDKVMVGVEDANIVVAALDEYREMEMNSGNAYPRTPDWMMSQAKIKAAIDAAGGEK